MTTAAGSSSSHTPEQPATYHLLDRDRQTLTELFTARPELKPYRLAPMHAVEGKSRDGLALVSYLTLPAESKAIGRRSRCRWYWSSMAVRGCGISSAIAAIINGWPTAAMPCFGQLSRLDRFRQGVRRGKRERARPQDA